MLKQTSCDGLMIGRGSVINPFIFHQIRSHFAGRSYEPKWSDLERYLGVYLAEIPLESSERLKINKMKQLMGFLFKSNPVLLEKRQQMLTTTATHLEAFLAQAIPLLREGWD